MPHRPLRWSGGPGTCCCSHRISISRPTTAGRPLRRRKRRPVSCRRTAHVGVRVGGVVDHDATLPITVRAISVTGWTEDSSASCWPGHSPTQWASSSPSATPTCPARSPCSALPAVSARSMQMLLNDVGASAAASEPRPPSGFDSCTVCRLEVFTPAPAGVTGQRRRHRATLHDEARHGRADRRRFVGRFASHDRPDGVDGGRRSTPVPRTRALLRAVPCSRNRRPDPSSQVASPVVVRGLPS